MKKQVTFKIVLLSLAVAFTLPFLQGDEAKDAPSKVAPPRKGTTLSKASTLNGMAIHNRQNEPLGEIKDVMLNLRNGRVQYAVMGTGGFLGMGDKLIALPPTALSASPDGKKLILQADKESLRAAPGVGKNNWPELADAGWLSERDRHYSEHAAASTENSIEEAAGAEKDRQKHSGTSTNTASEKELPIPPANIKLSELLGTKVQDLQKKMVGEISDAAVDLETGEVRYLVVSAGGVLGVGEKLFAIAPQLFRKSGSADTLLIPTTLEASKKAPGFNRDQWPEHADQTFGVVHEPAGTPLDPQSDGRTALDQSNSKRDIMITQQLRRSMMTDQNMSTLTRNITIITANGVITVRGTVESQQDVDRIVAFAREIAGNRVVNELKIKK